MKKVLVISKGIFHPAVQCRKQLKSILIDLNREYKFEFSAKLSKLNGIDIKVYHAVVLFFHEKNISDKQLDSLISFVQLGGKLVCIHGALASFKSSDKYLKLTGSEFKGHDVIQEMNITGTKNFTIIDELYKFELSKECRVLMTCNGIPVCWSKEEESSQVFCLSPGHKADTFKNTEFKKIIISAIRN